MIITLCGSSKFKTHFDEINFKLSIQGHLVFSLPVFSQAQSVKLSDEQITILMKLHFEKIRMSDAIFVVNPNRYIGEMTTLEIEFAERLGKKIIYLEMMS